MWPGSSPASLVNGAAGMMIAALVIAALYFGSALLIPFALAGIFSFILQPAVSWLHRRFVPRTVAVLSVVVAATTLLGLAGSFLAREASFLAEELPKYEGNLHEKAKSATSALQRVGIWYNAARVFERVEKDLKIPAESPPIKVEVQENEFRPLVTVFEYAKLTLAPLATVGLTFIFTILILLQYYDLRDRVVFLFGPAEIGRTTQAFNEAALDLSQFFRLQAGLNLSFGVVVGTALWLVGLPNPALWGALAAVSRFVPYIGGIIAAAGPLLMAASVDPGWGTFFATGAVILVAEVFVGYAVEPFLFGSKTRMSPLAVVTAAAFWTMLWGPVGLILALPVTLAIIVFGEHVPRLRFLQVVFGNHPPLNAAQRLYHLLLANNPGRAVEEVVRHMAEKKPLIDYVDQVFIPAMEIATKDLNGAVFRHDQLEALKRATEEFVELFKEASQMQDEAEERRPAPDSVGRALVVAGRGAFDQAVAELAAFLLKDSKGLQVSCTSMGGLTGIAASASATEALDYLAVATVGGVTEAQLNLLLRRARQDLAPRRAGALVGKHSISNFTGTPSVPLFSSLKALQRDMLVKHSGDAHLPEPPREQQNAQASKASAMRLPIG